MAKPSTDLKVLPTAMLSFQGMLIWKNHLQALTMGYSCRLSMLDTDLHADLSSQFTLRAKSILWMVRQVKEVISKVKLRTFAGREISQKQTKILVMPNRCKFRGDAFIV